MKRLYIITILWIATLSMYGQTPTIGLLQNDSLALNGYTLFTNSTTTYLIDNCGLTVNLWESEYRPGNSVYLLENGTLLRAGQVQGDFVGGGLGGIVELFDWDNTLLWSYIYADEARHHHHDIEPLPNGNFLLIAWEAKTREEMIDAGRDPDSILEDQIWPEEVVEIEMVGTDEINIVWEWHLWDHLIQDFDSTKMNYGVIAEHPELLDINYITDAEGRDWIHMNALNYNPTLDQIVLSANHLNEIWIIDHSTTTEEAASHMGGNSGKGGDILYRWGNPQVYDRGDPTDQKLFLQHDSRWVPTGLPNAGSLMVFNNGLGRPEGAFSSIDRWVAPIDSDGQYILADGAAYGPEIPDWTYVEDGFYSERLSGAQPLPNGNILICEGRAGDFFEITAQEEIVWQYTNPVANGSPAVQGTIPLTNATFRATKYDPTYPGFLDQDLTPGDPIELEPLPSDCIIFENPITSTDDFILREVRIRANPISERLIIDNETRDILNIEIFNAAGQLIKKTKNGNHVIDMAVQNWTSGLYLVTIYNQDYSKAISKRIIKL